MKTFVLYHGNCLDGTGAKYAAWNKFKEDKSVKYIPVWYNKPVPQEVLDAPKSKRVYILDFSYPLSVLEELRLNCKVLLVLDHHKSAQEALSGLEYAQFDMNKSGAVLAWEHFHPGIAVPELLLHIQDRDLWRWKLEGTAEITSALALLEGSMQAWEVIATNTEALLDLRKVGKALVSHMNIKVKSALKKVALRKWGGYKVGILNTTEYSSEIGNAICSDPNLNVDFSITYFVDSDNQVVLSLRSVGDFDVSRIAKDLGGGGHKNASGATMSLEFLNLFKNSLTECPAGI